MSHGAPPLQPPRALLDADRTRPALWRWMAFLTLVLVVVSLWVPVIPSDPPDPDRAATPFSAGNLALLFACVALAALVLPAPWRIRLVIAAALLGTTLLAWALEEPIREFLGPPFVRRGP